MKLSARLVVTFVLAALGLVFAGGIAYATSGDHDPSIGAIRVVEPCTAAQARANHDRGALGEHGDATYRCRETKPGCWQWIWQYDGRPKSGHTWSPRPCPKCSPSPSVSPTPSKSPSASAGPSTSPSASMSPSGSASTAGSPPSSASAKATPVAATLPITGTPNVVLGIAVTGVLLVLCGATLLLALARRRSTS